MSNIESISPSDDVQDAAFRHWLANVESKALVLQGYGEDEAAAMSRLEETADETMAAAERIWNGSSFVAKLYAIRAVAEAGLPVTDAVIEGIATQGVPV